MAAAAVLCSLTVSANSPAQITDPEEMKSWLFLQKLAAEIEEIHSCSVIELTETTGAETTSRYQKVVNEKAALFVHEVDAYIQRYSSKRQKTETPEAFRFRVWSWTIQSGARKARPIGKELTLSLCRAVAP
jgi:hypothetical protein